MMDAVVPGGVAVDLTRDAVAAISALVKTSRARLPTLISLYDKTASLMDRTVRTGALSKQLAQQFAAGGLRRARLGARFRRAPRLRLPAL